VRSSTAASSPAAASSSGRSGARTGPGRVADEPAGGLDGGGVALALEELAERAEHGVVQPGALRHVRDRHRPGRRLSPGVREFLTDVEAHMRAVADEFDRSR
jgi:hypothetical protein